VALHPKKPQEGFRFVRAWDEVVQAQDIQLIERALSEGLKVLQPVLLVTLVLVVP
jgi:hypothetical protein